jgi:Protein of unknown function (DUF3105)
MAKTNKPGQTAGSKQPSQSTVPPTLADRARARSDNKGKPGRPGAGKPAKPASARRQAQRRSRQRSFLYSGLALAVIGGLIAYITIGEREEDPGAVQQAFNERQAGLASARAAAGCTEIREFPEAGRNHINASQQASNWNSNPPTSGDHLDAPLPASFYPEQQDERALVHSLEHGYVAVQYKNLPQDQIAQLQSLQSGLGGQKLVVMRYDGLESDGVALSAWQRNQTCRTVDRNIIQAFIDGFMVPRGRLSRAPEPLAA